MYKQGGATADNGFVPYGVGGNPDRGSFGKGTKYAPTGGSGGFWNGTNFTHNASTQNIQPQIVGFSSNAASSNLTTSPFYTFVDGGKTPPHGRPSVKASLCLIKRRSTKPSAWVRTSTPPVAALSIGKAASQKSSPMTAR